MDGLEYFPFCPILANLSFLAPEPKAWGKSVPENGRKYFQIPFANELLTCLSFTENSM